MTPTEQSASNPSRNRGLLATLRASVSAKGTRAPKLSRSGRLAPLSLAAACVLLLLTFAPSASANSAHAFNSSFGASTSTPADPYPLSGPTSVAVNQTSHDVYVTDPKSFRVEEFDSSGAFVLMFGREVDKTTKANVCTAASTNTCGAGVQGSAGEGEFSTPTFIAVDNSTGESANDVYVGDTGTSTVYKFTAAGAYISANSGLATALGSFGPLAGIAVDASGDLWVYGENAVMSEFGQEGTFLQGWTTTEGAAPIGIAVDAAGDLYLGTAFRQIEELNSTGGRIALWTVSPNVGSPLTPTGIAFDRASGGLYVDNLGGSIEHIDGPCKLNSFGNECIATDTVETFGAPQLTGGAGLAVDSASHTVYAADATANQVDEFTVALEVITGSASAVAATTMTVNGTVNPEGSAVSDCRFEYGTSTAYGQSVPCEGAVGGGSSPVEVHAALTGLASDTAYHYRLVATNAKATVQGEDREQVTLVLPVIGAAPVTGLTETAAVLNATVNPLGLPVSLCEFEYGTSVSYDHVAPCAQSEKQIGSGTSPIPVSAAITGLKEGKTYHWRLLAADANGQSASTDQTFIYTKGTGGLPDNREYELVTPTRKNGAIVGAVFGGVSTSVAEGGQRVIAPSLQCFESAPSCVPDRELQGPTFEFARTASGWVTHPLTPAASSAEGFTPWSENANTGMLLYSADTPPQTADELYTLQAGIAPHDIGPTAETADFQSLRIFRATSDYSTIVYEGRERLWAFDETNPGQKHSLYEYPGSHAGEPSLVGVTTGTGSTTVISDCGTYSGEVGTGPGRYNSLSSDGRTVYFTAEECSAGENNGKPAVPANEVYVRIDQRDTELLSEHATVGCSSTCLNSPAGRAVFKGASTDGSTALFTSTQQLTDTASQDSTDSAGNCSEVTAGAGGCNLYESVCPSHCEHASERELVDVSAGDPKPRVQGVVTLSPDGSHVYFVADGVMTTSPNQQGETAQAGAPNLYVFEHAGHGAEQHIKFITRLSPEDSEEYIEGYEANVTPEGRYLVFTSHRALTPDDTRPEGPAQVYRYDSQTGTLLRLSQGAQGFNNNGNGGTGDASIANPAFLSVSGPARSDPTMSHDGSYVFFQSPVGLTPGALDDVSVAGGGLAQNVYEWHEGNVYLISDGKDTSPGTLITLNAVELIGSDATGANVFFTTYDSLVPQDTDTQRDIYDAHACSSAEPCLPPAPTPPVPCREEECHGPGTPSTAAGPPASATFTGAGNLIQAPPAAGKAKAKPQTRAQKLASALRACRKDKKKSKRTKCQKAAHKAYGAKARAKKSSARKSARRATTDRRGR